MPTGLFDVRTGPGSAVTVTTVVSTRKDSLDEYARQYKRSGSVTVVEGRRSGDIWMSNGDAVDGKSKLGRVVGMMAPAPKLSVLPSEDYDNAGQLTPPLPIQMEESYQKFGSATPQSQNSAELGRMRSLASSHYSGADDSIAYASKIMIAQKHYSALAQTVMVNASPDKDANGAITTGATFNQRSKGHLRNRSSTSGSMSRTNNGAAPSPPPSFPLPPTPPTLKNARLAQMKGHKKALSSGAFSLSILDDINEIDAMTAALLPGLIPGLKVGGNMKIRDDISPAGSLSKAARKKLSREFGGFASGEFSSPEVHSTPARKHGGRARTVSGHKRNHYSLPR